MLNRIIIAEVMLTLFGSRQTVSCLCHTVLGSLFDIDLLESAQTRIKNTQKVIYLPNRKFETIIMSQKEDGVRDDLTKIFNGQKQLKEAFIHR